VRDVKIWSHMEWLPVSNGVVVGGGGGGGGLMEGSAAFV